jgi:uncharacterized membrane protein
MPGEERTCPVCGAPSPANAVYCSVCGAELNPTEDARPAGGRQLTVEEQIAAIQRTLATMSKRLGRLETMAGARAASASPKPRPAPSAQRAPEPAALRPAPEPGEIGRRLPPPLRAAEPPSPPPPERKPIDLEDLISGQVLAWVGGLSLLLGALFFLSLAFSRGWIGPEARVVIGLVAGVALMAGGGWFFSRRERLFGHVLVSVGLGVLMMALFAATPRMYDFVRVEVALAGVLAASLVAAVIAIRANSQVVAAYGLIAGLIAPPLLGAEPAGTTIAYMSIVLVGTTAVSLYRTWRWLPALAFLFSAPQLGSWVTSDPPRLAVLVALGGYWLLHAIAAGGEEFRVRRHRLSVTSTTLLVANAAFVVWAGFETLAGDAASWRGLFMVIVALAHGVLGGYFLYQDGERHPFGMLAFGTGIAALAIAVPVQLSGPWVPLAWAAQAVALTWVYNERRHGYSGLMAMGLGALAIAHLVLVEYPIDIVDRGISSTYPFLNSSGATLAFLLAALAAAGYLLRRRTGQLVLAAVGATLMIYALPFELSDLWLLTSWSTMFVLTVAVWRYVPYDEADGEPGTRSPSPLSVPAFFTGWLALWHVLLIDIPLFDLGDSRPATPFWDSQALAALIVIAASLLAGFITGSPAARRAGIIAAAAIAAYVMPFQVSAAASVVGWSTLALVLGLFPKRDAEGARAYLAAATPLLALGLAVALLGVAPPDRLFVNARLQIDHPLLLSGATAALGALALVLAAGYWLYREHGRARWLALGAGVVAIYLLSVGVVDEFQSRVGGPTSIEDLQKQAQVALSILWAILGGGTFVTGVVRGVAAARIFGLSLLALTTTKVFLYDLASLDAAYRVLSFIGLGILLLVSAYVYQRMRPGGGDVEQMPA